MAVPVPRKSVSEAPRQRTYRITHQLGSGGHGTVCLAQMSYDAVTRGVAIKMMHERGGDAVEKLRDEARALGAINHPGVLQIITMDTFDGRPGLVTEYVIGLDLAEVIQQFGCPPTSVALEIVARTSDALGAALAQKGVIHRDIKPSNLRIATAGVVRVLDFGIAVSSEMTRYGPTTGNGLIGSPHYVDITRFVDEPRTPPHPGSDVFALGCVLFESIVGRRLFPHDMPSLAGLAYNEESYNDYVDRALDRHTDVIPLEVRSLVRRMVDYDREARPAHQEVERVCEALIRRLGGPTLKEWAREQPWPVLGERPGELVGRVYTSDTISGGFVTTEGGVTPTGPAPKRAAEPSPSVPTTHAFTAVRAAGVLGAGAIVAAVMVVGLGVMALVAAGVAVSYGWSTSPPADAPAAHVAAIAPEDPAAPAISPEADAAPDATPPDPDGTSPAGAKDRNTTIEPPVQPLPAPVSASAAPLALEHRAATVPTSAPSAVRVEKRSPEIVVVPDATIPVSSRSAVSFDTAGAPFRGWAIVDDVRTPLPADLDAGTVKIVYSYDGGPDVSLGSFSLAERDTLRIRCNGMLGTCSKR